MTSRNHHRITIAYQSHRRLSCEIICLILSNIWLQLCMCRSTVTITWPDGLTATSRTRMAATVVNRPFLFHQIWSQRVLVLSVMHRCARKRGKTVSPTRPPFQSMGSYRKLFLFQFYASLMRRHVSYLWYLILNRWLVIYELRAHRAMTFLFIYLYCFFRKWFILLGIMPILELPPSYDVTIEGQLHMLN